MEDRNLYKNNSEIQAVCTYLDKMNYEYKYSDLKLGEESGVVDVYFGRRNLKFQVTTVDGGSTRVQREGFFNPPPTKATEVLHRNVILPLHKKQKFSGDGVILLIQTILLPPIHKWLLPENEEERLKLRELRDGPCFDKVYLVSHMDSEMIDIDDLLNSSLE